LNAPRKFRAPYYPIREVEYGWVEWQAYEFAGRLLVPPDALRIAFQAAIHSAQAAGYSDWLAADEAALDYIATRIAPKFGSRRK
jgi:hypothetical protein